MPSPPSRLPSVEDPSSLGISIRTGLPHRLALGSNIEGSGMGSCSMCGKSRCGCMTGGKVGSSGTKSKILDFFTDTGTELGKPFKKKVGINPFTMGMDFGEKVVAPALMKIIPPKKQGRGVYMLGGQKGMRTMGRGL